MKHGHSAAGHHEFNPDHLVAMEERRRHFLPPEETIGLFLSERSVTLLDLGCGVGYFTVPIARYLTSGRVIAVDKQQNMVDATLRRAAEAGVTNVTGVVAPGSRIPLPARSVDVVLLATVYHDLADRAETLTETARLLSPDGFLYLIEIDRFEGGFGPPLEIRVTPGELRHDLETAGFRVEEERRSSIDAAIYFVHACVRDDR